MPTQDREIPRFDPSPGVLARIGGLLYLAIILIGIFGETFVRGRLVVAGDAAATALNLRSMETLWRVGIAAELLLLICAILLLGILVVLLGPVSSGLTLLAAFFNLVSIALEAAAAYQLVEALFPLGNAAYLKAFEPAQLDAMTYLPLRAFDNGFGISLLFFGCFCVVVGYVVFRSGFLPRTIGVLMQIAGVDYVFNSLALVLAPASATRLFPAILLPALVGEGAFCLWLLVKGVDVEKWNLARSRASAFDRA